MARAAGVDQPGPDISEAAEQCIHCVATTFLGGMTLNPQQKDEV